MLLSQRSNAESLLWLKTLFNLLPRELILCSLILNLSTKSAAFFKFSLSIYGYFLLLGTLQVMPIIDRLLEVWTEAPVCKKHIRKKPLSWAPTLMFDCLYQKHSSLKWETGPVTKIIVLLKLKHDKVVHSFQKCPLSFCCTLKWPLKKIQVQVKNKETNK